MQAITGSSAEMVRSRLNVLFHHDLPAVAMTTSSEHERENEEIEMLRQKAALVFHELEPKLRRMIEKRISSRLRGRVDVEVIFQTALSEILKTLESKQPKSEAELRAWIFKRTWSRWQDNLRRWSANVRNVRLEEPLPSGSDVALVGGIGVATNFGLKETVERIRQALKPVDFQIVELRIVDELSYDELAEFLGLTPESVRKRFVRALLKIKHVVASPFSSSS